MFLDIVYKSDSPQRRAIPIICVKMAAQIQITSRSDLSLSNRIVIKAGTSVVSNDDGFPSLSRMGNIVERAARLVHLGKEVIIVTSGAVGT